MLRIGYAGVSSSGQSLAVQLDKPCDSTVNRFCRNGNRDDQYLVGDHDAIASDAPRRLRARRRRKPVDRPAQRDDRHLDVNRRH